MARESIENLLGQLLEKLDTQAGPDRIVRNDQVFDLCGLKRSQLQELIGKGDFPKPFRPAGPDGRVKAWFGREISAWQQRRRDERDDNTDTDT
jgi:predicted DNA-binding transcriptional regulator AlpA